MPLPTTQQIMEARDGAPPEAFSPGISDKNKWMCTELSLILGYEPTDIFPVEGALALARRIVALEDSEMREAP